jgi:hypothetical protein
MALLTVISIDDVCGRHLTPPPGQIHRVLGRRATAGVGGGRTIVLEETKSSHPCRLLQR